MCSGLRRLSDAKIDQHVDAKIDEYARRLYGLTSYKPSKMQNGTMKQDRGFKGLVLCDDGFDERAERARRVGTVKQSVRC